eukprot:3170637-Pleurochrysis_carterae.AAC.1
MATSGYGGSHYAHPLLRCQSGPQNSINYEPRKLSGFYGLFLSGYEWLHVGRIRHLDSRAWVGVNLGRSVRSPGAYNIWVPASNQIVVASDVYFHSERLFPRLPSKNSDKNIAGHADGNSAQPPGLPAPSHATADATMPAPRHLAPSRTHTPAAASRRVHARRSFPASFAALLRSFRFGLTADCVDNCTTNGGGNLHIVLVDSEYERLLQRCADGYYTCVFASPPCSTMLHLIRFSLLFQCRLSRRETAIRAQS